MILISPELPVRVKLPPHVKKVRNRVGREYYYLTLHRGTARQAETVRLPDDPRAPEFWTAYARAMKLPEPRDNPKSVKALDLAWGGKPDGDGADAAPEWKALGPGTKREWKRHRARIVAAWGHLEVAGIAPKHVLALRDDWADTPATANNMLRCLSSMLGWSVPRDWRADNPCDNVPKLKGGEGYAPWPWEVIAAAEEELVAKGRADLWRAVALALYTGQRLGDCLRMLWTAIDAGGVISVKQSKTGKELFIPVHARLRAVLDATPRTAVTILTSADGTPWQTGFQGVWKKHRPALVAEHDLVFHGLRKSAVVMLLEAGCSTAEVQAITGQSIQMVEHYAKQVNQRHLAAAAILKWERADGTRTEQDLGTRLETRPPAALAGVVVSGSIPAPDTANGRHVPNPGQLCPSQSRAELEKQSSDSTNAKNRPRAPPGGNGARGLSCRRRPSGSSAGRAGHRREGARRTSGPLSPPNSI